MLRTISQLRREERKGNFKNTRQILTEKVNSRTDIFKDIELLNFDILSELLNEEIKFRERQLVGII